MCYKRKLIAVFFFFLTTICVASEFEIYEPKGLDIFRRAFSDISFTAFYDKKIDDWKITVAFSEDEEKEKDFYWCEGRFLPEDKISIKDRFLPLLEDYPYGEELESPSSYTEEEIEEYRYAGLSSSRNNDPFPATFLLDFIYSGNSRKEVEENITKVDFLGHKVTVNKRIVKALSAVEKRLEKAAETNTLVADFIEDGIGHLEGYNWRDIRDVERKSMHSIAIAIDILPPKLNKHIYWSWTKDQKGDKWMLTPLSSRWMPPYEVINIFEEEGFVWGGKWIVWDNMHFEYRPELLEYHKGKNEV